MMQETQDNQALAKHSNPERQRLAVLGAYSIANNRLA